MRNRLFVVALLGVSLSGCGLKPRGPELDVSTYDQAVSTILDALPKQAGQINACVGAIRSDRGRQLRLALDGLDLQSSLVILSASDEFVEYMAITLGEDSRGYVLRGYSDEVQRDTVLKQDEYRQLFSTIGNLHDGKGNRLPGLQNRTLSHSGCDFIIRLESGRSRYVDAFLERQNDADSEALERAMTDLDRWLFPESSEGSIESAE